MPGWVEGVGAGQGGEEDGAGVLSTLCATGMHASAYCTGQAYTASLYAVDTDITNRQKKRALHHRSRPRTTRPARIPGLLSRRATPDLLEPAPASEFAGSLHASAGRPLTYCRTQALPPAGERMKPTAQVLQASPVYLT